MVPIVGKQTVAGGAGLPPAVDMGISGWLLKGHGIAGIEIGW